MTIAPTDRPRLPRGVKLRRDDVRGRWTLLAPERIFEVDATAAAVLGLCDGERHVSNRARHASVNRECHGGNRSPY